MNWTRSPQRFVCRGMDLNHPVDLMPEGKFPLLRNVRSFQDGRVENRAGLQAINGTPLADTNIHTIFRMNDYVNGDFARFVGAGTKLYYGTTGFTVADTGYSGNPLSICPFVPVKSVSDWAYVADASRLRKINSAGTNYSMGIAPPIVIPTAELLAPAYQFPSTTGLEDDSPFNKTGSWGNNGSTTTPALNPVGMPGRLVGDSIANILYISGSTGWACAAITGGNPQQIVAGMRVIIGTGGGGTSEPTGNKEYATVEEVHKAYPASGVTVGQIIYDVGTSGLCTIEPSAPMAGLTRNTMLEIGSEFVRIISVTNGDNGISSFRCSTASTHSNGEAITPPTNGNIWIYLALTHASGEFIWCSVQQFQVNPGSKGGSGSVYNNVGTPGYNLAIAGGRPLTPDDYFHLSLWADHPEYLTQIQLVLDVDSATTNSHATTDGQRNAYTYSIKGSDLQQYIANLQTNDALRPQTIQDLLQAETNVSLPTPIIPPSKLGSGQTSTPVDVASTAGSNPPEPILNNTTSQLYTGSSQWTEIKIPFSNFVRIGSDQSGDFSSVKAIILNITVSNNTFISMAGMWVGGTYGPDVGGNLTPFIYRYRYRSSTIGCVSLPGPATRSGITAWRQGVQLVATASTDPQVDKIDWERLGGFNVSIGGVPDWHYLGTCDNSSPTIIDDQFSAALLPNAPLDTDTYQPFTVVSTPLLLAATVAGTAIKLTSGTVSTNMVMGTEILVNGKLTSLYASPTSTTLFHVVDSMGSGTGITILIQEPTLTGQPLPAMWGPYANSLFACGNPLLAGALYYTKPNDPDSSADTNYIIVSSPSEILMNGCTYDGKNYVFSDRKLYQIVESSGPNAFAYNEVMNGKGLISRWGLTVGPAIWFVASDGVYEIAGGTAPRMISQDIRPLFPQGEQKTGVGANNLNPIDTTKIIKLTYFNNYLFLDYTDTSGSLLTLVYDTILGAWFWDNYFGGVSNNAVNCHCAEYALFTSGEAIDLLAGTNGGTVYAYQGFSDQGDNILCEIDTPAFNNGDFRAFKQFGDVVFDADTQNVTVAVAPFANNYETPLTPGTIISSQRVVSLPYTFPNDTFAQNLAWKITWSTSTTFTRIYGWEPAFLPRPENTGNRATDWDDAEYEGNKFLQGLVLTADTFGQSRTVQIQVDFQTVATLTVSHSGQEMKPYVVDPAFTGHLFRIVPDDADEWRLFSVKWVWEPAPEFVTYWETQTTNHDIPGYQFLKDGYIALNSSAAVTLTVLVDNTSFSVILPSTGGAYKKLYFIFPFLASGMGLKGKLFKYILSSPSPFQLFQKDSEVYVHPWISSTVPFRSGGYDVKRPFGDVSRVGGARI